MEPSEKLISRKSKNNMKFESTFNNIDLIKNTPQNYPENNFDLEKQEKIIKKIPFVTTITPDILGNNKDGSNLLQKRLEDDYEDSEILDDFSNINLSGTLHLHYLGISYLSKFFPRKSSIITLFRQILFILLYSHIIK